MQEEARQGAEQDLGGAAGAQEPNVSAPGEAAPVGSEGLEAQEQPQQQGAEEAFVAPEVDPEAAGSAPTEQEGSAFDPSVSMRPEDLSAPTVVESPPVEPPDADQATGSDPNVGDVGALLEEPGGPGSEGYGDPDRFDAGDLGPGGTTPPGTLQQEEEPTEPAAAAEAPTEQAEEPYRTLRWEESSSESAAEEVPTAEQAEPAAYETLIWRDEQHSEPEEAPATEPAEGPLDAWVDDEGYILEPEHVLGPEGVSEQETEQPLGGAEEAAAATAAAAAAPNLADHLDPEWPVFENLSSQELLGVQEALSDPSSLSDPEVLQDLSPQQMQAMVQAFSGYLGASGSEQTDQEAGPLIEPEAPAGVGDPIVGDILYTDPPPAGQETVLGYGEGDDIIPDPNVYTDPSQETEPGYEEGDDTIAEDVSDVVDEILETPEEEPAPPPALEDMIDPEWPVMENLSAQDLLQVQEVLSDPSSLSDPEVLNELSPDQMQALVQAFSGYMSASDPTDVPGEVEDVDYDPTMPGGENIPWIDPWLETEPTIEPYWPDYDPNDVYVTDCWGVDEFTDCWLDPFGYDPWAYEEIPLDDVWSGGDFDLWDDWDDPYEYDPYESDPWSSDPYEYDPVGTFGGGDPWSSDPTTLEYTPTIGDIGSGFGDIGSGFGDIGSGFGDSVSGFGDNSFFPTVSEPIGGFVDETTSEDLGVLIGDTMVGAVEEDDGIFEDIELDVW